MAEWRNGGIAEWQNGGIAEWQNGGIAEWRNGGIAEWRNGISNKLAHCYVATIATVDFTCM